MSSLWTFQTSQQYIRETSAPTSNESQSTTYLSVTISVTLTQMMESESNIRFIHVGYMNWAESETATDTSEKQESHTKTFSE